MTKETKLLGVFATVVVLITFWADPDPSTSQSKTNAAPVVQYRVETQLQRLLEENGIPNALFLEIARQPRSITVGVRRADGVLAAVGRLQTPMSPGVLEVPLASRGLVVDAWASGPTFECRGVASDSVQPGAPVTHARLPAR